jgi:hypothetical protein
VVGALRERGVLSKQRRRTVEITNSRVAGLLAACVALVIGAYSIGLHRGGGDQMLSRVETVVPRPDDRGIVEVPRTDVPETPMTDARQAKTGRSASDEMRDARPSVDATDAEKGDVTAPKKESPAEPRPEPAADSEKHRSAEGAGSPEEQEEGLGERPAKVPASQPQKKAQPPQETLAPQETSQPQRNTGWDDAQPPQETQTPQATTKESVRMAKPEPEGVATLAQPQPTGEPALVFARTLSTLLNGTPVVADAPDSVRITLDDLGRMILIYTSDGPIRFRLAMEQAEPERMAHLAGPKPVDSAFDDTEPPLAFARTLSFLLNGTPVVVDAPDSVRITLDDLGRMILIYTSDGPIRFRLADDD